MTSPIKKRLAPTWIKFKEGRLCRTNRWISFSLSAIFIWKTISGIFHWTSSRTCIWIIVLICFDLYILGFSAIFLCFCWLKTWSCFPLYIIDTSGFLFFDFVIACKYQYSCFHIRDVAFDFHCTQALMHGRNFFVLMVESFNFQHKKNK